MLIDGPDSAPATIVLSHGAGAPMDTPYMTSTAEGLAASGLRVVRFEFTYMAKRREDGKRRGPDRMPALLAQWTEILDTLDPWQSPLFIGGKSMGGRSAATFAAESDHLNRLDGVICLGYPFHPPGKPEKTRLEPLHAATQPTLVVQGERDPFGKPEEVGAYEISDPVRIEWIPDGDHSFVPRKRSGYTEAENLDLAVRHITGFVDQIMTASKS